MRKRSLIFIFLFLIFSFSILNIFGGRSYNYHESTFGANQRIFEINNQEIDYNFLNQYRGDIYIIGKIVNSSDVAIYDPSYNLKDQLGFVNIKLDKYFTRQDYLNQTDTYLAIGECNQADQMQISCIDKNNFKSVFDLFNNQSTNYKIYSLTANSHQIDKLYLSGNQSLVNQISDDLRKLNLMEVERKISLSKVFIALGEELKDYRSSFMIISLILFSILYFLLTWIFTSLDAKKLKIKILHGYSLKNLTNDLLLKLLIIVIIALLSFISYFLLNLLFNIHHYLSVFSYLIVLIVFIIYFYLVEIICVVSSFNRIEQSL